MPWKCSGDGTGRTGDKVETKKTILSVEKEKPKMLQHHSSVHYIPAPVDGDRRQCGLGGNSAAAQFIYGTYWIDFWSCLPPPTLSSLKCSHSLVQSPAYVQFCKPILLAAPARLRIRTALLCITAPLITKYKGYTLTLFKP